MALLDNFVYSYTDKAYEYTALIRHQGVLISFAMDSDRRIYYAVLDLQASDSDRGQATGSSSTAQAPSQANPKSKNPLDVNYWPDTPELLPFPREVASVGYAAVGLIEISRAQPSDQQLPNQQAPGQQATSDLLENPFLTTTARLSAQAPFQVVSDGEDLYLFRQGVDAKDPNNFRVDDAVNRRGTSREKGAGQTVVDRTLLCDRYILAGNKLQLKHEVRYQRSRSRTIPQSETDSLNTQDMDGNEFYEPTQELEFVRHMAHGWFTVLLLPTQIANQQRWQIFAYNSQSQTLDSFNLEQAANGLFNLVPEQPIPAYHPPSEFALKFDGTGFVTLTAPTEQGIELVCTQGLTFEAWVCYDRMQRWSRILELSNGPSRGNVFLANVETTTTLRFGMYRGTPAIPQYVECKNFFETGAWIHLAVTVDAQGYVTVYKNGIAQPISAFVKGEQTLATNRPQFEIQERILRRHNYLGKGASDSDQLFVGSLDEVRIWTIARSAEDMTRDRLRRLHGDEPGLVAYWRCNEGSGTQVYDVTDRKYHGSFGSGVRWVPATITRSHAAAEPTITPDQLGVQPDVKINLGDRSVAAGLSAVLYHQQESARTGYDQEQKPLKQSARVMLAVGTHQSGDDRNYVALLDVGVSRHGRLAHIPTQLNLGLLPRDSSTSSQSIQQLQADAAQLRSQIHALTTQLQQMDAAIARGVVLFAQGQFRGAQVAAIPVGDLRGPVVRDNLARVFNAEEDMAGSLHVPPGLVVTLRGDFDMSGKRVDVKVAQSVFWLVDLSPTGWYLLIDRITVEMDAQQLAAHQTMRSQLLLLQQALQTKQAEIDALLATNASLMPLITMDAAGLTVAGGIADFAYTSSTPQLFDSATGQLTLYFQGSDRQFFSAYYQTLTARAEFYLTATGQATREGAPTASPIVVVCTARSADAAMDHMRLSITDVQGDRCTLTIQGPGEMTETWAHLPRDPRAFAATLNGQTTEPVYLGKLKDAIAPRSTPTTLRLDECRMESLSPYGVVHVGQQTLALSSTTRIGVSTVAIQALRTPKTLEIGTPVYWMVNGTAELLGSLATGVTVGQPTTQLHIASSKPGRSLPANAVLKFALDDPLTATLTTAVEVGVSSIAVTPTLFPNFVAAGSSVYYLPYNYAHHAKTAEGIDLSAGSRLLIARDAATTQTTLLSGNIINPGMLVTPEPDRDRRWVTAVQANRDQRTPNCRWIPANTGGAIALNGKDSYLNLNDLSQLKQLSLPPNFTFETWLKPQESIDAAILSFVADPQNSRDGSACAYQVGMQPDDSATNTYRIASTEPNKEFGLLFQAVNLQPVDLTQGMTIELWVYFESFSSILTVVSSTNLYSYDLGGLLILSAENASTSRDGTATADLVLSQFERHGFTQAITAPKALSLKRWMHLAVSIDPRGQVQLYRDGAALLPQPAAGKPLNSLILSQASVGPSLKGGSSFQGGVDDIRLWQRGRSQEEIQRDYPRRLFGNEPALLHYWYATDLDIKHYEIRDRISTNPPWVGKVLSKLQAMASPFPKSYRMSVGINHGNTKRSLRTKATFLPDRWTHLAVTFQQAYGVQFNGTNTYLDCGSDTSLDIQQDLTIEIFAYIEKLDRDCGLLSKGRFDRSNLNEETYDTTYALWVTSSGQIAFAFKDADSGQALTFVSSGPAVVQARKFHRVGVTRRCVADIQEIKKDGSLVDVKTREYTEIRFYLDDAPCGTAIIEGRRVSAGRNNQPLVIGKANSVNRQDIFCHGVISQVRVWSTARSAQHINRPVNRGGLVSWWKFTEATGRRAEDSQGSNHAGFRKECQWVKTPDDKASPITVYADGMQIDLEDAAPMAQPSKNQFAIGGTITDGKPTRLFQGWIEETRLWKTVRTPEQLLDNLFRELMGEQDALLAYYPYGLGDTAEVLDESGNGLSLAIAAPSPHAVRQPSNAPISLDAPQVRNALGGQRTSFNTLIHSAPAVHEYADLQSTSDGDMIGVFKRCYSYIQDQQWTLLTGFKVGDLSTEWLGQVQFAPQIIGFIEGAPPVPSENLTRQESYSGASSIELQSAQRTNYTYETTKGNSGFLGTDIKIQHGLDVEIKMNKGVGLAALVAVESKLAKVKALLGMRVTADLETSSSDTKTASKAKRVAQLSKMTLQGTRENAETASKDLGRRYVPKNVGFALVQSETGDVFALRLKHKDPAKRVLISYQIMPNPDIPKDWNIIHFPINPRYTKQGTLDGKVGLDFDVAYPNTTGYNSDRSYFKPQEAYAFKSEIEKQDQRMKSMYESEFMGRTTRPTSAVDFGKSNLVNTYVWTADGGLFTESTDTLEVYKENFATSVTFKATVGAVANLDVNVTGNVTVVDFSLTTGFQIRYSEAKTRESESSFNLNIEVNPERDIYLRARDANHNEIDRIVSDRNGEPKKQAGKVDAYRFMTFYLEPSKQNFERFYTSVVDPTWLAQSKDPSAIALRQARDANKKPPCWRIFHRVTYVSRVLPDIPSPSAPLSSLEQTITTLPDINSNYELIQKLDPFVRNHTESRGTLAEAIDSVLRSYLPELLIHRDEIVRFMVDFYGIQ